MLPNTKLRIDVPLIAYYTAVDGVRNQNRGILPDCPVTYTIQDELEGRDKVMEIASQLAAGQKANFLQTCRLLTWKCCDQSDAIGRTVGALRANQIPQK